MASTENTKAREMVNEKDVRIIPESRYANYRIMGPEGELIELSKVCVRNFSGYDLSDGRGVLIGKIDKVVYTPEGERIRLVLRKDDPSDKS